MHDDQACHSAISEIVIHLQKTSAPKVSPARANLQFADNKGMNGHGLRGDLQSWYVPKSAGDDPGVVSLPSSA